MLRNSWKAIYEDGTVFRQDWIANTGDSFGEVQRKGLPIRFFIGNKYGVNLRSGELYINKKWFPITDEYGQPLKPTRLIYARRNTVQVNQSGEEIPDSRTIVHRVGFAYDGGIVAVRIPQDGGPVTIAVIPNVEEAHDNYQRSGAEG